MRRSLWTVLLILTAMLFTVSSAFAQGPPDKARGLATAPGLTGAPGQSAFAPADPSDANQTVVAEASPASGHGDGAMRERGTFPVAGDVITCLDQTYEFTEGEAHFTFVGTPSGVLTTTVRGHNDIRLTTDGSDEYHIYGALRFTTVTPAGAEVFTGHFQIVERGTGVVDSTRQVMIVTPQGDVRFFDFGTCSTPESP